MQIPGQELFPNLRHFRLLVVCKDPGPREINHLEVDSGFKALGESLLL